MIVALIFDYLIFNYLILHYKIKTDNYIMVKNIKTQ